MPTGKELLAQQNVDSRPTIPASPDTPSKTLQDVQNKIEIARAELILAEIQGQRELPDKIKQRDEALLKREQAIKPLEDALTQRELTVGEREQAVISIEATAKSRLTAANKVVTESDMYDKTKRTAADSYYAAKVQEGKALDTSIQAKQAQLEDLNTKVFDKVQSLAKQIKAWTTAANTEATRSYYAAERSKGTTSQYHAKRSQGLWGLKDELDKILRSIGGLK